MAASAPQQSAGCQRLILRGRDGRYIYVYTGLSVPWEERTVTVWPSGQVTCQESSRCRGTSPRCLRRHT